MAALCLLGYLPHLSLGRLAAALEVRDQVRIRVERRRLRRFLVIGRVRLLFHGTPVYVMAADTQMTATPRELIATFNRRAFQMSTPRTWIA
jgi:hypothetical protein